MRARICVITAGHLATCPRMLKAADALAAEGYAVRVVSTRHVGWATAADAEVRATRRWAWSVVGYDERSDRATYLRSGLRQRAAQLLVRSMGAQRCPMGIVARAYSRVYPELVRAALAEPADFFYGGTTGALPAIAAAGKHTKVRYAVDLEDFHSAEQDESPTARRVHALAARIEHDVLRRATFLTASSAPIASAYRERYGVSPVVVNNTFPLPSLPPDLTPSSGDGLRLYWFSQTIGPQRGLEDAVEAMGRADIPGELHLRGRASPGYMDAIRQLGGVCAPRLRIVAHEPASPDAMVDLCRGLDVGLALEQGQVVNRQLCLTNKAFTYVLAGLAVAFTDTLGQRALAHDLGEAAILYAPGDVAALARGLRRWADDKALLARAKGASWAAAQRRWHWEHAEQRGALLRVVANAVG